MFPSNSVVPVPRAPFGVGDSNDHDMHRVLKKNHTKRITLHVAISTALGSRWKSLGIGKNFIESLLDRVCKPLRSSLAAFGIPIDGLVEIRSRAWSEINDLGHDGFSPGLRPEPATRES